MAFVLNILDFHTAHSWFEGMLKTDETAIVLNAIIMICAFVVVLTPYDKNIHINSIDSVTAILLFAVIGGLCMSMFGNMAVLFLGIEILSISLYILAGSAKLMSSSNEAAMKYFLMGSFATGFLLFGIALVYGATGSFSIEKIVSVVASWQQVPFMYITGVLLILTGVAFKVAAAPYHFWAPDVYEGAPSSYAAFMASAGKVAAIAVLIRLAHELYTPATQGLSVMLLIISILSILFKL